MQDITTRSWTMTTVQTDFAILTPASGKLLVVTYVNCMCSNSNTGDVEVRLGFAATTLPAVDEDSATGLTGMFFEHPGIARGGGAIASNGGASIAHGAVDEPIRLKCSAATGGSMRIVIASMEIDPAA